VHQIQVSPKVAGMVIKLSIEEGKHVKQGDVLAELETVDYLADRDRAKATLDSAKQHLLELERGNRPEEIQAAKADMEECEAQREQLYLDWKRNVSLKNGNALAPKDYEQAYSAYKAMDRHVARLRENYKLMVEGPRQEKIDSARADLAQAQADLAKAQWRLDNCIVRAPVTGTILTKKTEEGSIVNPIAFNVAASLCDMADLSDLEVDLNIQERDVAKVFRGQNCRIRPDAFPERTYEGYVSRLMPIADRAKGAVPVRVKVRVPKDEEGVYLKPEMSAVVSFLKKETSSK
jgi:multidrug resistance efflux pump